jgi:hypothetical protein
MKQGQKQNVEVREDVDTERLYGNIDGAIKYLEEIRDKFKGTNITLDEHWTGYENMEMNFLWTRLETDEELTRRTTPPIRPTGSRTRESASARSHGVSSFEADVWYVASVSRPYR